MVKKLRYFCTLLLMMVASVTWAGSVDDVLTSADFTATSSSYSFFTGVKKTSDAVYAGNSAKYSTGAIQMRSNNSNSGIVSTTSGGKITKVTITWDTNTVDARNLEVYGSNTAYSAASDLYGANSGTLLGTLNKKNNETEVEVSGDYAYVGIRSASGALYLTNVTFTWDDGKNDNLADPEFSFGDTNSFEVDQKADGTFPAFQAPTLNYADGFDGTVEYSSSNTDVATVNAQTGDVTIIGVGTAKIMAHAEATEKYNAGNAEYTITVNMYIDPTAGTEENPYTVAQARAAIDAVKPSSIENAYVKGIVYKVDKYNETYHSINYWISDDGTSTNPLQVYSGKGLESADFNSIEDVTVGDEVVVCGTLKDYNGTYEFDKNNYLVSTTHQDAPVVVDVATVNSLTPTSLTVGDEGTFVADVTVAVGVADDEYQVTFAADNDDVLTVSSTGTYKAVGKGTVTVTVHVEAVDAEHFNNVDKEFTVVVKNAAAPAATGDYKLVTSTDDIEDGQYLIVYEEIALNGALGSGIDHTQNYIGVAKSGDFIVATDAANAASFNVTAVNGGYAITTQDGTYIGHTGTKNTLNAQNTELVNTLSINEENREAVIACGEYYLRFNKASDQDRFRYYKSGQQAVYLYKRVNETAPAVTFNVNVTEAGYATLYYGASNLVVPEGVKASTYTVTEGQLQASKVYTANKVIPAGTGVVLEAAEGTYTFTATSEVAEAADANMLKGSDGGYQDKTEGYKYYILSYDKQGQNPGFYFQNEGGTYVTNGAHKAYLAVPEEVAGEAKFFTFGGETGINAVEAGKTNGVVYNLQGQRVENAQKGIFIMNGKKVVR